MHLLEDLAHAMGAPLSLLGFTGGVALQFDSHDEDGTATGNGVNVAVADLAAAWMQALMQALEESSA
jgi:hypothetical protein